MILMRWLPEVILLILIIWVYIYQIRIPLKNNQPLFPMFRSKRTSVENEITDLNEELEIANRRREAEELAQRVQEAQPPAPVAPKTSTTKKGNTRGK